MAARLMLISLWAEDVEKAAHFYKDVIELPLQTHHAGIPHFDLGDVTLVILQGKPGPVGETKPERFPLFALVVDNFDAALNRLASHHVDLPWGIETDGHSRWVMFYDPAGNLIEMVENDKFIRKD